MADQAPANATTCTSSTTTTTTSRTIITTTNTTPTTRTTTTTTTTTPTIRTTRTTTTNTTPTPTIVNPSDPPDNNTRSTPTTVTTSDPPDNTTAVSSRQPKGGPRTIPFIIATVVLERIANVGVGVNMVLYLTSNYGLSNARATKIIFLWNAASSIFQFIGACSSDSYFGRFRVIGLSILLGLLGIFLLWVTSMFPPWCGEPICQPPTVGQVALLCMSLVFMSLGAAGIRPCSSAFGEDQLTDPQNPKNENVLQRYSIRHDTAVGISAVIATTVVAYIQTRSNWPIGFGVPLGLMLISTLIFFLGSPRYVKVKANKGLFASFVHVIFAAVKNKNFDFSPNDPRVRYLHKDGSKPNPPSNKLRCLNRACVIKDQERDLNQYGIATNPWSLCTVQEVEKLKALIRVLPIMSSGFMIAISNGQTSIAFLQALTMDRHIGNFQVPAGSFAVFEILTSTMWIAIYKRFVVPRIFKYTKQPKGFSFKQQIGIGLVISCLATSAAAIVESHRRGRALEERLVNEPLAMVKMSALWLVPQFFLTGLSGSFNENGQIDFYTSQLPKSMSRIAASLFPLGVGVGNLFGILILSIVNGVTGKKGHEGWIGNNLNKGHYDKYYWVLTLLSVGNFLLYLLVSWHYGSETQNSWDDEESQEDGHLAGNGDRDQADLSVASNVEPFIC